MDSQLSESRSSEQSRLSRVHTSRRYRAILAVIQIFVGCWSVLMPHRNGGPLIGNWETRQYLFGLLFVAAGILLTWIRVLPVTNKAIVASGLGLTALNFVILALYTIDGSDPVMATSALAIAVGTLVALGIQLVPAFNHWSGWLRVNTDLAGLVGTLGALAIGASMVASGLDYKGFLFSNSSIIVPVGATLIIAGALRLIIAFRGGDSSRLLRITGAFAVAVPITLMIVALALDGLFMLPVMLGVTLVAVIDWDELGLRSRMQGNGQPIAGMNTARRRVALSGATAAAVSVMLALVVIEINEDNHAHHQVEEESIALAVGFAQELDLTLQSDFGALKVMEGYLEDSTLSGNDLEVAKTELLDIMDELGNFSSVSVVDELGQEVLRTDNLPLSNIKSDPAVALANTDSPIVGAPMIDAASGKEVLRVAYGIDNDQQEALGYSVIGMIETQTIRDLFTRSGSADYSVGILARDGSHILGEDRVLLQPQNATHASAVAGSIGASQFGHAEMETTVDGVKESVILGYSSLSGPAPWSVYVEEFESVGYAQFERGKDIAFVTLLLSVLAIAIGSSFFAKLMLKPAADLAVPVLAFGAGDYTVPIPEADDSEFGDLARSFGTMRTQLVEREARLEAANEELREASRQKSEFVAIMSHELRTPMDTILSYGNVLLDGLDGELTPQQAADVAQITESADHLLLLINNVLDYSKMDAGWTGNTPEAVDLAQVVNSVRLSLALEATEKGLEVISDVPEGLPPAWADGTAVTQILNNVVGNAIKFTEKGRVAVTVRENEGSLRIAVQDTGVGIPLESQPHIFEAFRQGDSSVARRFGGTGLGLAIAKRLVDLQGGTIDFTSQSGVGSLFVIALPTGRA
jgi:signal transduction histidine kinase